MLGLHYGDSTPLSAERSVLLIKLDHNPEMPLIILEAFIKKALNKTNHGPVYVV